MVSYDPSDWFKALALHKADTFRKLWPWLLLVGAFTYGVGFLELKRMGMGDCAEMTLKEIGRHYGLSRERIRQLQEQALTKMRKQIRE